MRIAFAALREIASGPCWPIVALSAGAWSLVIASDNSLLLPSLCVSHWTAGTASFIAVASTNSWTAQAVSWLVMLLAMMTPLVYPPLIHVWEHSLAERRVRAVLLFVGGYFGVWMVAMAVLTLLAIAVRIAAGSALAAFTISVGFAALWQMTPVKMRFLRRCHVLRPLPAFGLAADAASLRFGVEMGCYCIGSCWLIMLVPLTSDITHIAMLAAAVLMLTERYSAPRKATFRLA
jgi:predicted metal-binding membrane protein